MPNEAVEHYAAGAARFTADVRQMKMTTYDDINRFRSTDKAREVANGWLAAQRAGQVTSDYHMNLLAWTQTNPHVVLAIVLDLIDSVGDDDNTAEMIALGPVEWLVEHTDDSFTSMLTAAVADHPGFALYTKSRREHDTQHCWARLRKNGAEPPAGGDGKPAPQP